VIVITYVINSEKVQAHIKRGEVMGTHMWRGKKKIVEIEKR
jgi:hypothetical protein